MTNSLSQSDPATEGFENASPEAETEKGWSPNLSRGRTAVAVLLVAAGILTALYAWGLPPFDSGEERTNNAYVRGRTTVVSPQVSGYLVEVPVTDFQRVEKDALLARIDDAPFRDKVQQALANVEAQEATFANSAQSLRSARAQLELQDAAVASARAALQKAQADMNRINELVDEGSVSLRERDQAQAALRQARAGVRQAKAQRAIAAENVRSVIVGQGALEAQVEAAAAAKDLAEIERSRTEVRAPSSGRLSEVTARVGQLVTAGSQLMYIVPDDLWVVANFKETQISDMAAGQRATLEIDALDGIELTGRVQSIAPAASSEFSLVKPDTGAGNFVKVPQRIAVRIVLDEGQEAAKRLGPGMSVVATVHTKD
ncbi:HlyD family secretion protein [Erythrobacter sp. THAF29]|uniref:HlyD family secretion protein n=1 Tax=Erythrobacter sp. THAF29 TaxID=2587851 RepID=UPI001267DA91|nr:HlyD family secretion protein [Erythrobacter sp. THAF29]QFT78722.1 putative multidrug resistance protein EmrK [Erythrobacter sp. THAF29]